MDELLTRGIDQVLVRDELEARLAAGHKLRIKFGVDPTRPDIHLGHTVVLRKLRQLQDLGHTVIFLIGDYTTRIGDPSGRSKTRPILTDDEITVNAQTYLDQVGTILDVPKLEIRRNSEWWQKQSFADLLRLTSNMSVAQLIEREDFASRLSSGQELALHELLYPLMQAYDSVMLEADVEFGGTDQLFNLLAGRALQKKLGQKPQAVIVADLLVGLDGSKKMSKSLDNYVGLTDEPLDMYGKIMSLPDSLIAPYYKLCTDVPLGVIDELVKTLAGGANPRDSKASLAREIVTLYHGEAAAGDAESAWNKTYRDKQGPSEEQIEDKIFFAGQSGTLMDFLIAVDIVASRNKVWELVRAKGLRVNGETVTDPMMTIKHMDLINIGKTHFYRAKAD